MSEKKVAIVTGGTSGIGLATVNLLVKKGYMVYGISRHAVEEEPALWCHLCGDITDSESVHNFVSTVFKNEGRIDLLVNNAGFGISGAAEFTDIEAAKGIFDVNFFGGLRCAKEVIPYMRQAGGGKIIFTSSVAAIMPIPFQGFYSATKAAVNMLSCVLANETKKFGIKVCAVMPGDVSTGFTKARKKSLDGSQIYGQSIEASVAVMEHDEVTGMTPEKIANVIVKAAMKKRVKPLYTPGIKYKGCILLGKILPMSAINSILGKMYIK